jgi:hypothetical protein
MYEPAADVREFDPDRPTPGKTSRYRSSSMIRWTSRFIRLARSAE